MASMENQVASLQKERIINTSLKEDLARKKEENIRLFNEKEDLLMNVGESLKVPHMVRSQMGDSSLKKKFSCNHLSLHLYLAILVGNGTCLYSVQDKGGYC